jgi:hypothetical protein
VAISNMDGFFFTLVPVRAYEFLVAVFLPVLFWVVGLIINIELAIIVLLAVVAYGVKRHFSRNRAEGG